MTGCSCIFAGPRQHPIVHRRHAWHSCQIRLPSANFRICEQGVSRCELASILFQAMPVSSYNGRLFISQTPHPSLLSSFHSVFIPLCFLSNCSPHYSFLRFEFQLVLFHFVTTHSYASLHPFTMARLPNGLISFGTRANCTLELCPLEASILQYQPSIPGNAVIIGMFGLLMLVHLIQGIRWKTWSFMVCMLIGCVDEIVGYVGRIMLHSNPFSFAAFVIQVGK